MGIDVNFLDTFCAAAMDQGRALMTRDGRLHYTQTALSDGTRRLRAKVIDSFNFVDHPQIEVDAAGEQVLQFSCDCPEYRTGKNFCPHCAVLVLSMEAEKSICHMAAQGQEPSGAAALSLTEAPIGEPASPGFSDFNYRFANSQAHLYPHTKHPQIGQDVYLRAFHEARAIALWKRQGEWGGNCFGMMASCSLMQQKKPQVEARDFYVAAEYPRDLHTFHYNEPEDLTVLQFIELMQILQNSRLIQRELYINGRNGQPMAELVDRVKKFRSGEGQPVMMCVWGKEGGHAILPYDVEEVSSTKTTLHIYDPNWHQETRYAYLEKNENGEYVNWRFPMFGDVVFSNTTGGFLNMVSYAAFEKAWDSIPINDEGNYLLTKPGVALCSDTGTVLARVTEAGVESYRDDIFPVITFGTNHTGEGRLSLPVGSYTLRLEDPQQNELTAHMIGDDLAVEVVTTAREVVIHVEDGQMIADAQIAQPHSNYHITILNTFGAEPERVTLEGMTGTERLHLAHREGRLYQRGLTDIAVLRVNGALRSLKDIRSLEALENQLEPEQERILNTAAKNEADEAQP